MSHTDYFAAVQEGRRRVKEAVELLQEVAGPSSPVLFLRMETKDWTPVGEESLFSIVKGRNSTAAVVLCDGAGNAKAISGWVPEIEAEGFARSLEGKGLSRFEGDVVLPL